MTLFSNAHRVKNVDVKEDLLLHTRANGILNLVIMYSSKKLVTTLAVQFLNVSASINLVL